MKLDVISDSPLSRVQKELDDMFDDLPRCKTVDEFKVEFREKCIVQIKLAVYGLNEIGIECSFDESILKIK